MTEEQIASSNELQQELEQLSGKELYLWSIVLLVGLVLAAGFSALIFPRVAWSAREIRIESPYLRQMSVGLVVLLVLFNIYILEQRKLLARLRREVTHQLIRAHTAEAVALIDPLTGTLNRRLLQHLLGSEISRIKRTGGRLTVAMVDVDDFKTVNTRFGHLRGDTVLRELAQMLCSNFRASDAVIRYGGDEFLLILSNTSPDQAIRALLRLQEKVGDWNRANSHLGWSLSISCGLAEYSSEMGIEELLTAADQDMYRHKQLHREGAQPYLYGTSAGNQRA